MDISQKEKDDIIENFIKVSMPAFDLGMGNILFGFTFYIVVFLFDRLFQKGNRENYWDLDYRSKF